MWSFLQLKFESTFIFLGLIIVQLFHNMFFSKMYFDPPIYNSLCDLNLVSKYWKIFKLSDFSQLHSKSSILSFHFTSLVSKDIRKSNFKCKTLQYILWIFSMNKIFRDNFTVPVSVPKYMTLKNKPYIFKYIYIKNISSNKMRGFFHRY